MTKKKRRVILIVDDEDDIRTTFRYHFEDLDFDVEEAGNGEDALAIAEARSDALAVVVTDIRMPKMGGEELIRRLREHWPSLPIIGVTGHEDLRGKLELLGRGAYYYLEKPFDPWPVMERLIDNAIRVYDLEREIRRRRGKEQELARLVRSYILQNASRAASEVISAAVPREDAGETTGADEGVERHLALDISLASLDTAEPAGDFAEWFERDGDEVIFYVADAAGHADLMPCILACLSSIVIHRSHHREKPTVERMISILDRDLQELRKLNALDSKHYLTFFLGSIDLRGGLMRYVSAAHNDVLLLRPDKDDEIRPEVRRLNSTCRPVGSPVGCNARVEELRLVPGDLLFVFTDGAYEHLAGGLNELERVATPLLAHPSQAVVHEVARYLENHFLPRGFPDDTTLMAIKVMAT